MKQSIDRDRIVSRHGDLLGLPPTEGLAATGDRIAALTADIAALRKLEHSYRAKARWEGSAKMPKVAPDPVMGERVIDIETLSDSAFDKILRSMQER